MVGQLQSEFWRAYYDWWYPWLEVSFWIDRRLVMQDLQDTRSYLLSSPSSHNILKQSIATSSYCDDVPIEIFISPISPSDSSDELMAGSCCHAVFEAKIAQKDASNNSLLSMVSSSDVYIDYDLNRELSTGTLADNDTIISNSANATEFSRND